MMFRGKSIFNASFDVFANNYHSVRPGYPVSLFEDIGDQCGIIPTSQILEIGAGSGIATVELAKLHCRVVAIEPGAHLAAIAREQTEKLTNVEVFDGTFENFQSAEKFDAILAFTAFHWLSEGDKYRQVLELLNDSGNLVLVWNSFFQGNSPVVTEVNSAYRQYLPDVYPQESIIADVNEGVLSKLNQREQEVISSQLFYSVFLKKYLVAYHYDSETYPKLLNTFPKIIEVKEQQRVEFLGHIAEIVKRHGTISVPVLTTLIVCQKRKDFLSEVANFRGSV